jgi:hypothetical protein
MSIYSDALDMLVTQLSDALSLPATRDPATVPALVASGGCVFVQFPTHVQRLMGGPNLEVPVSLVAPAPSDLLAVDWLLEHMDDLVNAVGSKLVSNGPLDIGTNTYPAVTATAQVAIQIGA